MTEIGRRGFVAAVATAGAAAPAASANGSQESPTPTTTDGSQSSDLRIVSARLPTTMRGGEEYTASVRIENTGDQPLDVLFAYHFLGGHVTRDAVPTTIDPGIQESEQFQIDLQLIDEATEESLTPGEYSHSIGAEEGPREVRSVTIEGTPRSQRGFFTNDGDGIAVLSNVFNLTVLGFLLSVAGVVYQMLEGS